MIGAIIFSNNAPLFLDLFLKSIKDNGINIFNFSVLYKAEGLGNEEYLKVFEKYDIINHRKETNFKEDLLWLINSNSSDLIAFFKDTNYFFSELPHGDIEKIMEDQDIFCFSLCLGKNIKHCYYNDVYNILLNEVENSENTIKWDWVKHYLDFGRPLELGGGHIFHKKEVFKMFKKWSYIDILGLEDSFEKLEYYPKEHMSSFKNSVLVDVVLKDSRENLKTFDFKSLDRIVIEN